MNGPGPAGCAPGRRRSGVAGATAVAEVAPGVHRVTLGRGPLASNAYLVRSTAGWVLIDAGWGSSAAAVRAAAGRTFAGVPPAAILLTHIHPDHSGAAGELARSWGVPVHVHPDEVPMAAGRYLPAFSMPLDRWLVVPLMRLLPAAARRRIEAAGDITDVVRPLDADGLVAALPGWQWVATPGHTPGHVAYRRAEDGVVISGDAALTVDLNSPRGVLLGRPEVAGPPRYTTWDWTTALSSLRTLAATEPRVLLPGHGGPLSTGTAAALDELAERRRLWGGLEPQYTGRQRYRPPPRWYVRLQGLGHALTRLGLSPGYVVVLEVPGRRSGLVRRTNVVLVEHEHRQYLVALAGESEWVRNVRAAGGHVLLSRRQRRAATLAEVPADARAPIIRAYLLRGGRPPGAVAVIREARNVFGVSGPDPEEIATVTSRYPVFRVTDGWR